MATKTIILWRGNNNQQNKNSSSNNKNNQMYTRSKRARLCPQEKPFLDNVLRTLTPPLTPPRKKKKKTKERKINKEGWGLGEVVRRKTITKNKQKKTKPKTEINTEGLGLGEVSPKTKGKNKMSLLNSNQKFELKKCKAKHWLCVSTRKAPKFNIPQNHNKNWGFGRWKIFLEGIKGHIPGFWPFSETQLSPFLWGGGACLPRNTKMLWNSNFVSWNPCLITEVVAIKSLRGGRLKSRFSVPC